MLRFVLVTLAFFTLPALADQGLPRALANIVDGDGEPIGQAEFIQAASGTLVRLSLNGLPPGPKAVHIHAVGTCDDHCDGFMDSGGHLNPDGRKHGLLNPDGPDAGDLPNFYVHESGQAWAEFYTTAASLDGSFGATILDSDGAALVIHENPDDHLSQPIGGAGARIACGVIEAAEAWALPEASERE
ncbi:MAG: superoxide dismutase family protein [Wenzhouxiangella sp.]|nr:MAG: superoxide dismutase family protein [Wenzhouxiangella sp.]